MNRPARYTTQPASSYTPVVLADDYLTLEASQATSVDPNVRAQRIFAEDTTCCGLQHTAGRSDRERPFHFYTKIVRQHRDTTAQTIESTIGLNVNHCRVLSFYAIFIVSVAFIE